MKAKELIGHKATRTAPAIYPNGLRDNSYFGEVVFIANADDEAVSIAYLDSFMSGKTYTLGKCWSDDNWKLMDGFMKTADKNYAKFLNRGKWFKNLFRKRK